MFSRMYRLARRRLGALATAYRRGGPLGLARKLRQAAGYRLRPARQRLVPDRVVSLEPASGDAVEAPEVTVVVTARDRDDLLPATLRSIQLQKGVSWECVVVDDGSSDRSCEVAQRFAVADKRFRVFTQEHSGVSVARNLGISVAGAPLLCFIDDDDLMRAGSLAERASSMREAPVDVAGSYCDWINVDHSAELIDHPRLGARRRLGVITLASARHGTPFISSSPMLRVRVLRQVGGFDKAMRRGEDAHLWQRILEAGYRFVPADVMGIEYRRTPGSLVLSDPAEQLASLSFGGSREPLVPNPASEDSTPALSLADIALGAERARQTFRYLALMAVRDLENAVDVGRKLLPACVVLELDVETLAHELTVSARNRLSLDKSTASARAAAETIRSLCDQLHHHAIVDAEKFVAASADESNSMPDPQQSFREMTPRLEIVGADHIADGSILMVAEALYHVDELGPLADELRARGHVVEFMVAPRTVEPARLALEGYAERLVDFDPSAGARAAAVVVLNDWGKARALVEVANEHGVPTFAKVEGVQDFEDVDTGRIRSPYRTAAFVLAQGSNDVAALADRTTIVVGSSRLERLEQSEAPARSDLVLINLNFTFGVLTDARDKWIDTVVEGVRMAGAAALVSAHPAERSRPDGLDVSNKPFRYDIRRAGVLVTRFSTVPFEALAYGVPFIYHNPHEELVPTFKRPDGAFRITRTGPELAEAIHAALGERTGLSAAEQRFFSAQVDVDPLRSSEQRTADAILAVLENA